LDGEAPILNETIIRPETFKDLEKCDILLVNSESEDVAAKAAADWVSRPELQLLPASGNKTQYPQASSVRNSGRRQSGRRAPSLLPASSPGKLSRATEESKEKADW
jgi:hypothetical protein